MSVESILTVAALKVFKRGDFALAAQLFEPLLVCGDPPAALSILYAVSKAQSGDFDAAMSLFSIVEVADEEQGSLRELIALARPWMPGGKHSPDVRRDLAKSACRFLPRLPRQTRITPESE